MEAIIRTNDANVFNSLLQFLKSLHILVETKGDKKIQNRTTEKPAITPQKKFNSREYEGILNHLNLDVEQELQNMRNGWKKRTL